MIRPATREDLDFVYQLYMDPVINPYLLYEPMDKEKFAPIYQDLLDKKVKYIYSSGDTVTGMFKLIPLQFRNSHVAYLGGVAVNTAKAGKGEGRKMMEEILLMARKAGFKRVELTVDVINLRAIRLYEQAGFQLEGILRQYTYLKSEDRYLDEQYMAWIDPGQG